jgi:hypothetical protein
MPGLSGLSNQSCDLKRREDLGEFAICCQPFAELAIDDRKDAGTARSGGVPFR